MKRSDLVSTIAATAVLLSLASASLAQETSQVTFAPGSYGTTVAGTVKGRAYRDFSIEAGQAQELAVSLAVTETDGNGTAYFNVLPPGSDGFAIYNGSTLGNEASIALPEDGTYTVRVYLMGNDRDTNRTVGFNLDVSVR